MTDGRRLVEVSWLDHASFDSSHWREIEEIQSLTPFKVKTVGWVVNEDSDVIIVVATISDNDPDEYEERASGEMMILKKAITNIKDLK